MPDKKKKDELKDKDLDKVTGGRGDRTRPDRTSGDRGAKDSARGAKGGMGQSKGFEGPTIKPS